MVEKNNEAGPSETWYKLDNAAKLYPAIQNKTWGSVYRLSVLLREQVDPEILQQALERTVKRLPGFAVRLKRGFFWYYFEPNKTSPLIQQDVVNPCKRMFDKNERGYLFRIRFYCRRIALEVFHSISDANGSLVFLKTLTAEYLRILGHSIPTCDGVLDCNEKPHSEEMEDGFQKFANLNIFKSRKESKAYHIPGTQLPGHQINIITGLMPLDSVKAAAKEHHVTITEFLAGALIYILYNIQKTEGKRRIYPIKISIPVNLRRFYNTQTLRNFSSFVNPGIDPNYGEFSFEEILSHIHHYMGFEITEKRLNARVATNVKSERNLMLRIVPLFIKNMVISYAFYQTGESRFTSTLSNIGNVAVPDEMKPYIERFDFILGPARYNKVHCALCSFENTLCINFTRIIKEPFVERDFFRFLVKMGIRVKVESNQEV